MEELLPELCCPKGGLVSLGPGHLKDEWDVTCGVCGTVGSDLVSRPEASNLIAEHLENGVKVRFGERIWEDSFDTEKAEPEDLRDRYLRLVAIVRRIQRETDASIESARGHTYNDDEDGCQLAWVEGRGMEWEWERRIFMTDSEALLWEEVTGTGEAYREEVDRLRDSGAYTFDPPSLPDDLGDPIPYATRVTVDTDGRWVRTEQWEKRSDGSFGYQVSGPDDSKNESAGDLEPVDPPDSGLTWAEKIEASSLGTPAAKSIRARTPRDVAERIVRLSSERSDGHE